MAIIKQDYGSIGGGTLNPTMTDTAYVAGYTAADITVDTSKRYIVCAFIIYNNADLMNIFYVDKGVLSDVRTTGNLPTTMIGTTTVRLNYNQSCTQPYYYYLIQLD